MWPAAPNLICFGVCGRKAINKPNPTLQLYLCRHDTYLPCVRVQMFSRCHHLVQQIRSHSVHGKQLEQKIATNIVASLARTLQEMSSNFRRSQSAYLKSQWTSFRWLHLNKVLLFFSWILYVCVLIVVYWENSSNSSHTWCTLNPG
jgi:hypothetical protein